MKNENELEVLLRSPSMREFNVAVADMACLPTQTAIVLVEALSRELDEEFRCRAVAALPKISKGCGEKLALQMLHDSSPLVRVNAIDSLRKLGSVASSGPIAALLVEDPDELVRSWAAFALGKIGNVTHLPILESAAVSDEGTDHEGKPIRETAAESIRRILSRD